MSAIGSASQRRRQPSPISAASAQKTRNLWYANQNFGDIVGDDPRSHMFWILRITIHA